MENYETKLLHRLLGNDLDGIIQIVSEELNCFVNITDESYHVITQYPKEYIHEPIWDTYLESKPLPADIINMLNDNKLIEMGKTMDKPCIIPLENEQGFQRVSAKISQNDRIYGYLTAYFKDEINSDVLIKLEVAQRVISYVMDKMNASSSFIENIYELFLNNLFNQMIHDEKELESWMDLLYAPIQGPYCLVCAFSFNDNNVPYLNSILREIKSQYHYDLCTIYKEKIYLLFDSIHDKTKELTIRQLLHFLKSYGLKIGISSNFANLLKTSIYQKQASLVALDASKGEIKYFMDHALDLLKNELKQEEVYYHPAIEQLTLFDEKNHTEYLKTLYAYLRNFGSHILIEKELQIHRNTVYNRIRFIENTMGIDLTDAYTFVHLYLSYTMIVHDAQS